MNTSFVSYFYSKHRLFFIISICLEDRNVFTRFDEIRSMNL